jgi:hypothetical protein
MLARVNSLSYTRTSAKLKELDRLYVKATSKATRKYFKEVCETLYTDSQSKPFSHFRTYLSHAYNSINDQHLYRLPNVTSVKNELDSSSESFTYLQCLRQLNGIGELQAFFKLFDVDTVYNKLKTWRLALLEKNNVN